jgi:autotransporter-associated beta strand protein
MPSMRTATSPSGWAVSGNINLNGVTQKVGLTNSSYLYGSVTNGGLSVDALTYTNAAPVSRTLYLYTSNNLGDGVTLTSTNSATNRTLLVLAVAHNQALGSGALTFAANPSATLKAIVDNRTLANDVIINTGITAIFDAGTNAVVSNDQATTNTVNSDMTISGSISGSGALVKTNDGILTLSGTLSYSGGTTVSGGTLVRITNNILASVTSNTIAITFSNTPANGTYAVLPGALTGTYTATYNNLSSSQKATFSTVSPASVTVASKSSQTITGLATTDTKTTADTAYTLSVTPGASTSPLTFSSDNPLVATISSTGQVVIVGVGTTTIKVNQAGDANYLAADEVTQTLTVTSAGPTFESAYPGVNLADVAPNGLTYLVNYAFGGSSSNAPKLPVQDTTDPTKLKLVAYVRTNNTAGTITVKGQTGSSLSSWDATLIDGVPASDNTGAPTGTQKQIFSVDASGDRQFLRLKVTK